MFIDLCTSRFLTGSSSTVYSQGLLWTPRFLLQDSSSQFLDLYGKLPKPSASTLSCGDSSLCSYFPVCSLPGLLWSSVWFAWLFLVCLSGLLSPASLGHSATSQHQNLSLAVTSIHTLISKAGLHWVWSSVCQILGCHVWKPRFGP